NRSLLSKFFKSLDDGIADHLDPPLHPSLDPQKVLSGNFAPVGELPPTDCKIVEGSIPSSLRGAYIRNGPNPQFVPRGPYHLFDGDGMLHVLTIDGGKQEAVFCSRFVTTNKYDAEREAGYAYFFSAFTALNGFLPYMARTLVVLFRFLAGDFDIHRGFGAANTSLFHFAGKLFALVESDLPYEVELTPDGDVITLSRHDSFGGPFRVMTAHPKIDPDSGEAFAFRQCFKFPFLVYFRIDPRGNKQPEVPITSLKDFSLIHDFAITQNYAIFPDTQIVVRPGNVLKSQPLITVDSGKSPRLGILPRNAEDDEGICWVEVPGFNMVHAVNAWEEDGGDTIVVVATNVEGLEKALLEMDSSRGSIDMIRINVKEKTARWTPLSTSNLEYAVINNRYVGRKNRYVYAGIGAPMPKISGVVKLDLLKLTDAYSAGDCTAARRLFKQGCYGGEPYFVARDPNDTQNDEDDGYVLSYIHDENIGESSFIIMDAKSPELDVLATVKLPRRVPYGFHGIFV
ncbi:hypothetical protein M569_16072, partial [Genlisea aurea]